MPTLEELKEISRRFIDEVFNKRNLKHAEEMLAEDFVEHSPPLPGMPTDKSGAIQGFKLFLDSSDDLHAEIIEQVSDGRRIAIRARYTGTDTGGFFPGMPATHKRYDFEGIDVATIGDDGKFTEHYGIPDAMKAMGQLGLAPSGPPPA
ncbi:MAG: ester cyclase [Actinobacteria bacterium]|nr:ester cyclase [Actinomycetota bacterium]